MEKVHLMIRRVSKTIADLKTLRQDWKRFREVRHIRPGMVVTWGAAMNSARVIANNASGLVLDFEAGGRPDVFSKLPAGLRILPPDTPVGRIR